MTFKIEAYSFGSIVINGKTYKKDLIICPDRIVENWWRREGHSLFQEDLIPVMGLKPRTLIIGTGSPGRLRVPGDTKDWLAKIGVALVELPTKEACEHYNKLADKSQTLAGLHLTC